MLYAERVSLEESPSCYKIIIAGYPPYYKNKNEHFKNISSTSTTHLGFLEELDSLSLLSFHPFYSLFSNSIKTKIVDISTLKKENLPSLLFSYTGDTSLIHSPYLKQISSIIPIDDYLEKHPLGRAEWLKIFGVYLGKYEKALEAFNSLEKNFFYWQEQAKKYPKISLLLGRYTKGQWIAPPPKGILLTLISLAGGEDFLSFLAPISSSAQERSIPLPIFEKTLFSSPTRPLFWFTNLNFSSKIQALFETPENLSKTLDKIPVIFDYSGDYWEYAAARPDLLLKDFVFIFREQKENTRWLKILK